MTCKYCGDPVGLIIDDGSSLCKHCWNNLLGIAPAPFPKIPELILTGMKMLAGVCDGARARDGAGFDGRDTSFGHSVAGQGYLSQRQLPIAAKMICKYHRQLPPDIVEPVKKWREEHAS